MSRELKFRGWGKKQKKYVDVQVVRFGLNGLPVQIEVKDSKEMSVAIYSASADEYVLEQYTGLKDKNGKEIYEGDFVKQLVYALDGNERTTTWVARWNNDSFCYDLYRISGALYGTSMLAGCKSEDCEVIGNIHENPELLEEKP